jgi:uncharacterized membrane protein
VGALSCNDCDGAQQTSLTLYTMGTGGSPLVYRMTRRGIGAGQNGAQEFQGPWSAVTRGADAIARIEPYGDARQSFLRVNADALLLMDGAEKPLPTQQNNTLLRDSGVTAAQLEPPRALFTGTLRRDAERLLLTPCNGGKERRVLDVSPESVITAAITDIRFDHVTESGMHFEAFGRVEGDEIYVDRLNRAGTEMRCLQRQLRFQAVGNEPFWSVVSGNDGARFTRLGEADLNAPPLTLSWSWPGGRRDRAEGRLTWETESSVVATMLSPKICRDTMADAVFGFTAVVEIKQPPPETRFHGCAFLGSEYLP